MRFKSRELSHSPRRVRALRFGTLFGILAGTASADAPLPALPDFSAQRAYGYLEVLAGQIGERPAGSAAESRAVEYIAGQFKSWGLDTTIQAVHVPVWHERRARLWAEGEVTRDFPVKAIVFSGVTKPEGLTAGFVDLGAASARDIRGKDLKDKIVLVKRDVYIDYPDYWLTDRLKPLGVAGMVFYSSAGRRGIPTAYFNFKRALKEPTPPSVDMSYEDAVRLVQMKPRRVGIVVEADIDWQDSHSVFAELQGAAKPDEVVMFSAHDDSAYSSPGATDDGGGVAAVMELARAFAQRPKPARTLRFVAWGGHELGLMGSEQYLRTHPDEPRKIVAFINFDGMGSTLGTIDWTASGDPKWVQFLHDTQVALGMEDVGGVGPSGTDATNFSSLEVPSIQIGQRHSIGQNHTPADNLETTSAVGMEDGLALAGAIGLRLATDTRLNFTHHFPPAVLKDERDYAARWGWGIRPESN
jgi:Iap family predicted aminopeptidase